MKEKLNKYMEVHDRYISALVEFANAENEFIKRSSYPNTSIVRKRIKNLRLILRELLGVTLERRKEFAAEWAAGEHQYHLKKKKKNVDIPESSSGDPS